MIPIDIKWQRNKYVDRLVREWETHKKIIIALDFDDTISPWGFKTEEDAEQFKMVFREVIKSKNLGAYVVIFTSCTPDRYDYIREYCRQNGLEIDSINQNPIDLPYGNSSKIYANIFLDDRAGLQEALAILIIARDIYFRNNIALSEQNVEF